MLSLKLVRSLVLGDTSNIPLQTQQSDTYNDGGRHNTDAAGDDGVASVLANSTIEGRDDCYLRPTTTRKRRTRRRRRNEVARIQKSQTPLLLFVPTRELITDAYRLATIARDIGMDLYPNASLSHLLYSWPSSLSSPSLHPFSSSPSPSPSYRQSFSSSSRPSVSSSSTLTIASSSCTLPNDAVPLPFPSLCTASLSLLRYFVSVSKGLFRLVYLDSKIDTDVDLNEKLSTWDCSTFSLISRNSGLRIESMDCFSRVLAGHGWTFFKTRDKSIPDSDGLQFNGACSVYLFRKVDAGRIMVRDANGQGRIRELRLPHLDFDNLPLRILQYIVLMTDDIFILA